MIIPTRAQFRAFVDLPRDEPVEMFNALKYRATARYETPLEDGRSTDVSGEEAYGRYKEVFVPWLTACGGSLIWNASVVLELIGQAVGWDEVFVARYPRAQDFIDMQFDPSYQKSLVHRNAALEAALLIRCTSRPGNTA